MAELPWPRSGARRAERPVRLLWTRAGGCQNTVLMLALAPSEVLVDRATAGDTRPIAELIPELRAHGVRKVSPNGVLGDPAGASATEGTRLLDLLVANLSETLDSLLADA